MVRVLEPVADKQPHLVAFGLRLKAKREAAGLSQAALGELVGLHRVSIARLEAGAWDVSLTMLRLLADALGTTTGELLEQPSPPPRSLGKRK